MKALKKSTLIVSAVFASAVLFNSCGSTSNAAPAKTVQEQKAPAPEKRTLNVVDSVFENYKTTVTGKSVKITSIPREIVLGKNFTSPYQITVLNEENLPVKDFELSVMYPSERTATEIQFTSVTVKTNDSGVADFTPAQPAHTFNSQISVCPAGNFENKKVSELAHKYTVTAPFKVSTNLKSSGGTLAIVDFTVSGKPITGNFATSSEMLKKMSKLKYRVPGNAPVEIANKVLGGDEQAIYKTSKAMFAGYSQYLVFGTVKHDSEPVTADGTTTVTLKAEIKCMILKDGTITYDTVKTVSASGKNEWDATAAARTLLAEELSGELVYSM